MSASRGLKTDDRRRSFDFSFPNFNFRVCFLGRIDLGEDLIHDSGGQKNLAVWNGRRNVGADADVEALDQFLLSRVRIQPATQEIPNFLAAAAEALARRAQSTLKEAEL